MLTEQHDGCLSCGLNECSFVPGYGPEKAELVVVGEAPGTTEVEKRRPFVGEAGKLLNKALQVVGVDREKVYITNTVLCRPWPHRAPKPAEVKACRPRLIEEIRSRHPRVVLALGSVAMRTLLPGKVSIEQEHGAAYWSDELCCSVVPAIHPAAILRNPGRYRFADLVRAVKVAVDASSTHTEKADGNFTAILCDSYNDLSLVSYEPTRLHDAMYLDVEVASDGRLLAVGFAYRPEQVYILTERALADRRVLKWLGEVVGSPATRLVGHNLKYDVQVLWRHGVGSARIDGDTLLMHYTLDERQGVHGLKAICRKLFKAPDWEEPVKPYKNQPEKCPRDVLYSYNAKDVYYTAALHARLNTELDEHSWKVLHELLIPAANVLARMEYTGILVDREEISRQGEELSAEIARLVRDMRQLVGREFNPDSPKQLLHLLYKELDLPVPGRLSTDEEALLMIREYHPLPDLLLQYRKAKKLYSTYIEGLEELMDRDGRVHTTFNLHGTVTGRLSSSRPNLQNIPRPDTDGGRVRNLFVATPGYILVQGDLSQAEVRVLAYYSQDKTLIEAMEHEDIHTRTASLMFRVSPEEVTKELRTAAKRITFGLIYGMSTQSLARELDVSLAEAEELVDKFFSIFPKAREWIEDTKAFVLAHGYVETPFGRRRRFDVITRENRGEVLRQAVNTLIQSVASDLTLSALIRLGNAFLGEDESTRLLLTVHDSILLETRSEVAEIASIVKKEMEQVPSWVGVPFVAEVEVGWRWGSLQKWQHESSLEDNRVEDQALECPTKAV